MSEGGEVQDVDAEVVVPSGADSSIGGGAAAAAGGIAAAAGEDGRVVPVLDGAANTSTLRSKNGTQVVVNIVPQAAGKNSKRSWV